MSSTVGWATRPLSARRDRARTVITERASAVRAWARAPLAVQKTHALTVRWAGAAATACSSAALRLGGVFGTAGVAARNDRAQTAGSRRRMVAMVQDWTSRRKACSPAREPAHATRMAGAPVWGRMGPGRT